MVPSAVTVLAKPLPAGLIAACRGAVACGSVGLRGVPVDVSQTRAHPTAAEVPDGRCGGPHASSELPSVSMIRSWSEYGALKSRGRGSAEAKSQRYTAPRQEVRS